MTFVFLGSLMGSGEPGVSKILGPSISSVARLPSTDFSRCKTAVRSSEQRTMTGDGAALPLADAPSASESAKANSRATFTIVASSETCKTAWALGRSYGQFDVPTWSSYAQVPATPRGPHMPSLLKPRAGVPRRS